MSVGPSENVLLVPLDIRCEKSFPKLVIVEIARTLDFTLASTGGSEFGVEPSGDVVPVPWHGPEHVLHLHFD